MSAAAAAEAEPACGVSVLQDYDLGLHVGVAAIIFVTAGLGVAVPLIAGWVSRKKNEDEGEDDPTAFGKEAGVARSFFFLAKHFGNGIIMSTSFIHLLFEGFNAFADPCLGELEFPPTAAALALGGAFFTFILDFVGTRQRTISMKRQLSLKSPPSTETVNEYKKDPNMDMTERGALPTVAAGPMEQKLDRYQLELMKQAELKWQITLLEAGILFHSVMIGVTLGADSGPGWMTLCIVIAIHQTFEGVALGARIASLKFISRLRGALMGSAFTLITPLGMAIGISVRSSFSGSATASILTVGISNSFSSGILLYSVFKLLGDDFTNGPLKEAAGWKGSLAIFAMMIGAGVMALIGKWA